MIGMTIEEATILYAEKQMEGINVHIEATARLVEADHAELAGKVVLVRTVQFDDMEKEDVDIQGSPVVARALPMTRGSASRHDLLELG
jgi:hypothetical protein